MFSKNFMKLFKWIQWVELSILLSKLLYCKYCCCSVAKLFLTLCDPIDCSTSGFLVHHKFPELDQTHVHQVSDAIQPSHPLSSPAPLTFMYIWSGVAIAFSIYGLYPQPNYKDIQLQFSCSVMLQHSRPPCPSPTPGVYPNSCSSRQWCHPTISSSVVPFSSCLQSFPASGSFPKSQFFAQSVLQLQHQLFQWIVRTDFL